MNKLVMALLLAAVAQAGCDQDQPSIVIVTPSSVVVIDDADAVAWEGGFLWVAAAPVDPAGTVDATAAAAASAHTIPTSFSPAGCAGATASGNVTVLQLDGCAGPFGIGGATGAVTFTFTGGVDGAQIAVHAVNLQVGGGSLTMHATGTLSGSGSARTLTVITDGGGIGPNGSSLAHQGDYTITWSAGDVCATIDGTVTAGTVNVQSTSFKSFVLCETGCPRSGTVLFTDAASGETLTSTYDGTMTITVVSSNGRRTTTTLTCG